MAKKSHQDPIALFHVWRGRAKNGRPDISGLPYEAQVDYYTKYIQRREDWEFVNIYADVDTPYRLTSKSS